MSVKTLIARTAEQLCPLQALWQACFDQDQYATVFQSFAWNHACARHLGHIEQPYVIAAQDDEGHTTIIPGALKDDTCTLLGESLGDYRSILTTDAESESFAAAFRSLQELGLPLRFTALHPAHHEVFNRFSTQSFCGAPYLTAKTACNFASEHNRMFSRLRKLQRLGFELHQHDGGASDLLHWVYKRKADADSASLFRESTRVATLIDALATLAHSVQVVTIERDAIVIAAAVAFRDRGFLRFYTNWYDLEWAHYSPGMLLLFEMTRQALVAGLSCDYLTGEQPYKMRLANRVANLRRVDASTEELWRASEHLAGRSRSSASSV